MHMRSDELSCEVQTDVQASPYCHALTASICDMRNIYAARERQLSISWETTFGSASCLSIDAEAGLVYAAGDGLVVSCLRSQDGKVGQAGLKSR